jgi:hypothetical protein
MDDIKPPGSGHQLARGTECSIQVNTRNQFVKGVAREKRPRQSIDPPDIGLLYGPFYSRRGHASICIHSVARLRGLCNVGNRPGLLGFAACKAGRFAYISASSL